MKHLILALLCLHSALILFAQQDLGIRNSNYAGIQGALLNPSSIADSKLIWDVNVLSGNEVFANNFLYAPKGSVPFFGFGRIISGALKENLFGTRYDPQNPYKLYNLAMSTEVLGPSFFVRIRHRHEIGLTISSRGYANVRDITGNLGENAFAYFLDGNLWNTNYHDSAVRVNTMSWMEYGFHYATVLYSKGKDELKVGVSLNYLQGIAAGYAKNVKLNYRIDSTTGMVFTNSSLDYGRTDFDSYKHIRSFGDLNQGHGFGMDAGVTYVHFRDPLTKDYLYRIGLSLLDAGSILFNRNAAAYHLQTTEGSFPNWHEAKFTSNVQVDKAMSAIFYNGDSSASYSGKQFRMGMPMALSIQADWNVYKHFFANLTVIKGFGHGNGQGVVRPDIYGLTPRYETKWGEISLPFSLIDYHHLQPRLGLAARIGYFFIGGDALGGLVKANDLESVDFYAGVHFFLTEKKGL